ncbi:helix-turn-helix domain-containing protein [Glutamicibacter endophyticus]|uniref:helix-turn-helix domain-containing protein n=1 Tax=Glutamicibacter endophyticus TaxID=1522174 RepID=UPI003AF1C38D
MAATPATSSIDHRKDDELTVPEVARRLKRHPQTVREYIHSGLLPAHRVGIGMRSEFRVYESDLKRVVHPVVAAEISGHSPVDPRWLAERIIELWPRLPEDFKAELSRLVAVS